MYKILRTILFLFPAEWTHYFSMNCLRILCRFRFLRKILASAHKPNLKQVPFKGVGLHFANRIGLGAGFDKNAKYLRELERLGFGFVGIGTVTPSPQTGTEKPRLFRL